MHPPLQVDLLTLKVVSESRATWATSVPILVFLGFSVLDLGPMYVTDRQTDAKRQTYIRRASSLNVPYPRGRGIITSIPPKSKCTYTVQKSQLRLALLGKLADTTA